MDSKYVLGIDYGSDSARTVLVNVRDGSILSQGVAYYPRWKKGLYRHPEQNIFRQHPQDYLDALEESVRLALDGLDEQQRASIVGVGIDTTGSTPAPVNREGTPLALLDEFAENENAMFYLWKDHSAAAEAEEVNAAFSDGSGEDYTRYQGKYCSEWFWAKILHGIRQDERVREAAYTWVEHCDWMVGLLCGNTWPETIYHSACAAGHKALWHSSWKGLPAGERLERLDPYLALVARRYGEAPRPATVKAGTLTAEWARRLGLKPGIAVSGSSFDAHAGAVGAGIRHKTLVCTLGTSAVDMLVERAEALDGKEITAYCGQAENSIVPGFVGIETGQAAFGDVLAWFKELLMWPVRQARGLLPESDYASLCRTLDGEMLTRLEQETKSLPMEPFPIVLDWFNGRRYPNTDDFQKGAIGQLNLGISAPCLYRSLVFGILSGLKRIVEGFENAGVEIDQVVAVGGISKKSPFLMQMMADLLGKRVKILEADQTCALGAAIYAAIGSGCYADMAEATKNMASRSIREYCPDKDRGNAYQPYYRKYCEMARRAERRNP